MCECATIVVKFIFIFFNCIVTATGLSFVLAGIFLERAIVDCCESLGGVIHFPPITLIVIGCIIFIVGFSGCYGAIRENRCMLITYAIIVFAIFLLQILGGGLIVGYTNDAEDTVLTKLEDSVKHYDFAKGIVDKVQSYFLCCGYNGPRDYYYRMRIPSSCCENEDPCVGGSPNMYKKGCKQSLQEFIQSIGNTVGAVTLGMTVAEIVVVVVAVCLVFAINNPETEESSEDF